MNNKLIISILILGITIFLGFNTLKPKENIVTDVFKEKIEKEVNTLTLEEKIAQMLIISFEGSTLNSSLKEELEKYPVGGVILFKDNITDYNQTLNLITDIENTSKIPMFISVDQEGGKVARFTKVNPYQFTTIPPMAELGKTLNSSLAYDVGTVIAKELRTMHVNLNFAPVLDINKGNSFIGNRSFGADPTEVSKMAIALAQGLIDNSIIPVYKHFPGHGSTITDSHYELPIINKNKEELLNDDLIPFRRAIDAGAEVIMVGHLATPLLTGNNTPASLSKEIIQDLLIEELGYDGLIITDALNMQALTNYYTEQEIYEMAINAGVNILLMPKGIEDAINLIKDSLNKGTISLESINKSVTKILELKYSRLNNNYEDVTVLNSPEHQNIINDITN